MSIDEIGNPASRLNLTKVEVQLAKDLVVSLVTLSAAYMDHFVALEKGYFHEQNLSVEYIRAGGGVATPALLSGKLPLSTSAGSALSAGCAAGR